MAASNQEKVLVLAFSVIAYERSCGPSFPALFCTHCNISIPGTGISGGVAGGHPGAGGGRHQGRGRVTLEPATAVTSKLPSTTNMAATRGPLSSLFEGRTPLKTSFVVTLVTSGHKLQREYFNTSK